MVACPRGYVEKNPMRRGFTLLELIAYIGLLTTLLVMVGSAEQSIRTTLWVQQAQIDAHQRAVAFESRLRLDIRSALRVEQLAEDRLVLTLAEGEPTVWSFSKGELRRDGRLVTAGLESWAFATSDGGVRFDGTVRARVGRLERRLGIAGWSAPRTAGGL